MLAVLCMMGNYHNTATTSGKGGGGLLGGGVFFCSVIYLFLINSWISVVASVVGHSCAISTFLFL